ncbi:MAG: putative Ig domain-containing protein, partial [Halanaerobiales bacterium]
MKKSFILLVSLLILYLLSGAVLAGEIINETENNIPQITSMPLTITEEGTRYIYEINGLDIEGDQLTYSLEKSPDNMMIGAESGKIVWAPTGVQAGKHEIVIKVVDNNVRETTQNYILDVADTVNNQPVLTSSPVVVAKEGEEYTYDVNADDPDGHKLVYKLLESPTGMIINEVTGEISWIPSSGQAGQHNISINVSDGRGGSTTQDLVVEVESANHAPEIISTPVTEVTVKRNVGEAELMDLSGWEVITYDDWNYEANPSPNWIIDEETNTARQTLNANASILLSDFDLSNHIMEGTWRVDSSADDDFMGFVFAYQNENQYYLFDWKQTSQSYPDYGYAKAGMSVKVVNTGSPPLANDLWESEGNGERVKVLYHNDISYEDFTDYHFSLHFKSGSFTITVKEGEKVLDIINIEDDTYTSGKFGFYNFSQEQLIYQGFKRSLLPGGRYKYDVEAVDQDNDEITYSLIESPEEMIIDSETGEINWLAIKNDIGKHIIKVKAEDEEGLYDIQSYILEVIEEENNPPEITSEPVIEAKEGNEYTYDVEAEDIDGDSLTYSLEQGPEDMAIDNGSGLINWIPQDIDVGNHQIVVSVSDGIDIITQEFIIEVIPTNYSPEITSTPATTTKEAEEYSYDVEAEDSDGDTLTYSLLESPENMTIESSTGLITWLPERGRAGEYNVKVQVVDGNGGKATQEFSIIVESINNPPVINGCEKISQEGHIYKYAIQAEDPEGDELTYNLIDPPAELTIDSEKGIMTWDTENVDFEEYTAGVKVTDSYGAYSSGELILERAKYEPPQITSTPVTSITIGEGLSEDYNYDVEAEDPAGDTLTYSLVSSPEGMTIDADTGLINWTPTEEQIGEHQIDIKVSNTRDAYAQQSYSLIVERLNNSPEITSTPVKNVTAGNEYVYELEAVDPDGDTLTYILKTAPSDMVIYEDTGIVNWIPDSSQVGQHQIEIEVQDGNGGVALQDYTLTVTEESVENTPPVITSTPPANNQLTEDYSYDVEAEDDDGDTLTYSLVQSPAGMIIDDSTGLITWNSTDLQVGTFTVEIEVSDGKGGTASQNYEVTISDQPVNSKPKIISTPVYSGEVGKEYSYDVEAEDVDGDTLTYTLTTAPDGMTIDSSTGMITWTPDDIQSGSNYAIVEVNDGNGGSSSQAFNIQVSGSINNDDDNIRPEVNIELSGPYMESGSTVEITLTATDDVGVVSRRLMVNGEEMTLDENYQAYYQSNTPGVIVVEGYATDAAGNEGYDKKEITFLTTGGDTTPPTAEISSPESGTELTMPTDIKGTASDDAELVLYKLEYSPQGEDKYVEFARGDTSVVDGTLGQFDPTQLKNGYYDVRLTALDGNGNQKSIIETYKVEGQVKVGNFSISFNDINIPVSGIPITVTRTYDSRDRSSGDFGHGWNMDIGNISLKESNHPAKFWYHDSRKEILYGSVPINIYYLEPIRDHIVTISYPDGRVDEFEMIFNPSESEIGPIMETNVEYRPTDGTNSRLEAIGNNTVMPYNGSVGGTEEVELRDSSLDLYNPDRYKLTQSDGTVLIINQNTGLEKITDKHGNEIVIDENGITHSAGKSVQFTRDSEGRITSITDPEGNMINYSYDYYGDLTSVTDQEGNITRFTYNSTHGLIDIIDPRGVRATRNEYDENGRLVAHVDADGNRIEFEHSIGDRQEIVKDRLGNVNVYDYDADGNILQETDALGNKTSYTYDSDGNKTSEKDALGNTISYDYDENGNMLSKTDKNGNKVEYTYNNDDQILSTTDALGNVTTNEYDNDGNLKQSTDVKGNTTEYTYDSVGNLIKKIDHKGNETSYSYDRYGNMISQTDEAGNTTSYDYDQNGNPISKMVTRTTSSGVTTLTTGYEYDKKNRLIKTIYHDGSTSQTIYNAIDKVAVEIDRLENRTEYEYDKAGNLAKEIYPDGTEETYEYDVEGNKTSYTDRAGRTTNYEYDAVGQLTKITHSDGSIIETTYNDVGRIQEKTDELGNKTAYTYDPVGNCTSVTDASGNTVKYEYNEQNKKIKMTDAGGNITEYEYNEQGLNTKIIYPDGTTQAMTYDSAGNMLTETDQAGITTEYIYDTLNRLIKVIDVSGNETSYTYDEAGNMLTETDANGNTTSYEYNERGQMIKKTLPLGMTESYSYDLAGNMISRTDYDGNTTTYEYDSNNRLIKKILPDLSSETYTYTPTGKIKTVKITDAKIGGIEKTTSYEYNNRNR